MEQSELEHVVKDIDDRVTRIEQILPTLVTKDDLKMAIAPLPTRTEMGAAIQTALEPLATRVEMRDEGERTRRHFDVIAVRLRDDIRLLAEGQVSLVQRVDELRIELKGDIARLDGRVMRLEVGSR